MSNGTSLEEQLGYIRASLDFLRDSSAKQAEDAAVSRRMVKEKVDRIEDAVEELAGRVRSIERFVDTARPVMQALHDQQQRYLGVKKFWLGLGAIIVALGGLIAGFWDDLKGLFQ